MKWLISLVALTLFSSSFSFAQEKSANKQAVKLNRLAKESSPYLRLHAKNPVDWYPWGEEAFAKAKKENKPILLSIGYSTCHWCHVMERESFEDEKIAAFLNKHFVSIKLDREERPDIDKIYMTSYNVMSGESGGWPLNVFLTPDLKMFYGGTYFPPRDRAGRVGFEKVIQQLNVAWTEKNGDVITSANELNKHMQKALDSRKSNSEVVDKYILELAVTNMMSSGDKERGGWGGAKGPKFPQPSHLTYLLRSWQRNENKVGNNDLLKFIKLTAARMANGGMHDHLGGGFHRYTVDGEWLVPHFEKMLYDQAQLIDFYLDLYVITKEEKYKAIASSTANYVMTEMQSEQGGYYCAQDAQSEGKEGKYWCWTMKELRDLLDKDELAEAIKYFHLTEKGNFYDHSDPEALKLQNILSLSPNSGQQQLSKNLASAISKMKVARAKRIPPATDKKILASWNGLMIGSMARAGIVLENPKYTTSANAAIDFIKSTMWKKNESGKYRLAHSYYDRTELEHAGTVKAVISEQAQSYVLMLQACRRLYEMTLDPEMLSMAIQLAETSRELFYDEKRGGFYESVVRADVLLRLKGDYDGAMPTSSSVGMVEFLRLYEITQRKDFLAVAEGTMKAHGEELSLHPSSLSYMLSGIDHYYAEKQRVVIVGDNAEERKTYLQYFNTHWHPNITLMSNAGDVDKFTKNLPQVDGETTIYLCEGVTCKPPVTSLE
ncbi:MAG: hypothetical protein ACI9E1_000855, partial [Cryomorphaceae bacterium]